LGCCPPLLLGGLPPTAARVGHTFAFGYASNFCLVGGWLASLPPPIRGATNQQPKATFAFCCSWQQAARQPGSQAARQPGSRQYKATQQPAASSQQPAASSQQQQKAKGAKVALFLFLVFK